MSEVPLILPVSPNLHSNLPFRDEGVLRYHALAMPRKIDLSIHIYLTACKSYLKVEYLLLQFEIPLSNVALGFE